MVGMIGKKLGMTQVFNEDGSQVPVTAVQVGPCVVVQRKSKDTDGYDAVQLGFEEQKPHRVTKARLGHFKKAELAPQKVLCEFQATLCCEGFVETYTHISSNSISLRLHFPEDGLIILIQNTAIGLQFPARDKRLTDKSTLQTGAAVTTHFLPEVPDQWVRLQTNLCSQSGCFVCCRAGLLDRRIVLESQFHEFW